MRTAKADAARPGRKFAFPGKNKMLKGGKRSTRLSFFVAGFGLACWAPLIPFAQIRINADPATLGSLLLCLGLGAVVGMPISGGLSARIGSRFVIIGGAAIVALALPLLAFLATPFQLGLCLLLFGAAVGAIDVAANTHGAEVQNTARVPLMSGFHGLYSIGALVGAGSMTLGLASGLNTLFAASLASAVILTCILLALPGFFTRRAKEPQPFLVFPKGVVTIIGLLTLTLFLAEGAMLDWSALLLTQIKMMDVKLSGAGYVLFSLAMVISRLAGDKATTRIGVGPMLVGGIALTGVGITCTALFQQIPLTLAAMTLTGLAAGNVVPVLFTLAARQKNMPTAHAIAAISILGYTGVLLGPALIGYTAKLIGLNTAFYTLALLVLSTLLLLPQIGLFNKQTNIPS